MLSLRKSLLSVLLLSLTFSWPLNAQTIHVDALRGKDTATGDEIFPVQSLKMAVEKAEVLSGNVTISIHPGLYIMDGLLMLRNAKDSSRLTIMASIMPDDSGWSPQSMPVIQSISPNNSETQFSHSTGFLVAQNNVRFAGLKFIGNPNPAVKYYYPISRKDTLLAGLEVTQCYFIGEKNTAPIQGAVWAHGGDININHSIFYQCKNALLLF